MTMQERQEMFAKEYLSIKDFEKLYDINDKQASKMILDIKRGLETTKTLRLKVQGKLHIQDYLDYMGITSDRYGIAAEGINNGEAQV